MGIPRMEGLSYVVCCYFPELSTGMEQGLQDIS